MSIRLRIIEGRMVALCAARSVPADGDIYLDDAVHYALSQKFMADLDELAGGTLGADPEYARRMESGESNNPARDQWESDYGHRQSATPTPASTGGEMISNELLEDTIAQAEGEMSQLDARRNALEAMIASLKSLLLRPAPERHPYPDLPLPPDERVAAVDHHAVG